MRASNLDILRVVLVAGSLASGCSIVTSLDGWTFGDEDPGQTDGGPMDASQADAGPACTADLTDCSGECVDLDSSSEHCGACMNACPTPPNTVALCTAGTCGWECAAGFADCNGEPADGCEVDTANDPLNCGACESSCVNDLASLSCREGTCRPRLLWVRGFGDRGSGGNSTVTGVAIDADGNVYITGVFQGIINFGGADLESEKNDLDRHTHDVFVTSFTATGEHRWSRRGGGPGFDYVTAIAFDGSGSAPRIHVAGYFSETARFDQHPSESDSITLTSKGRTDFFIASFDAASGSHVASRSWGGSGDEYARDIALDPTGNIYVTGSFASSDADLGGPGTDSSAGGADIFVASYPPAYVSTGQARWAKRFGSAGWEEGQAITVDASGKVYVTGYYSDPINFGTSPESALSEDGGVFVACFNSRGIHDWSIGQGGTGDGAGASGIALDAEGNIYLAGNFGGTLSLGGDTLESTSMDVFIASYDASGSHRWSHGAGGPEPDSGNAIAVSTNGEVYSTGSFVHNVDFGGGALRTSSEAAFIATHGAASGALHASFAVGGPDGAAAGQSIAAGDGLVCAGGSFIGSVKIGGDGSLIAVGGQEALIACFDP